MWNKNRRLSKSSLLISTTLIDLNSIRRNKIKWSIIRRYTSQTKITSCRPERQAICDRLACTTLPQETWMKQDRSCSLKEINLSKVVVLKREEKVWIQISISLRISLCHTVFKSNFAQWTTSLKVAVHHWSQLTRHQPRRKAIGSKLRTHYLQLLRHLSNHQCNLAWSLAD